MKSGLLSRIRDVVGQVQDDAELNAVRFRHTATWAGSGATVRFSVQEPSKTQSGMRLAQAHAQTVPDLTLEQIRLLRVHPEDMQLLEVGDTIPWDRGRVTLVSWSQVSDFTHSALGILRYEL